MIHTLRIIGNSCADTGRRPRRITLSRLPSEANVNLANAIADQNRQRVVATDCLPRIVKLLRDDPIIPLVAPVLFNICVDYGKT